MTHSVNGRQPDIQRGIEPRDPALLLLGPVIRTLVELNVKSKEQTGQNEPHLDTREAVVMRHELAHSRI